MAISLWIILIIYRGMACWLGYKYALSFKKKAALWIAMAIIIPTGTLAYIWVHNQPTHLRKFYWLIALTGFVYYANTLVNGYAMDDELVTKDNSRIEQGVEGIYKIFTQRYAQNPQANYEYRPIVLLSYALEYEAFGPDPTVSHFINLLLYVLLGFMLFFLTLKLFKNFHWILPLTITMLFMIHPVHNEVVASLKNRDEMLCLAFGLGSLLLLLNAKGNKELWKVVVAAILLILGLISKKSIMTFMFLIPFTLLFFDYNKENVKKAVVFILSLVVIIVITRLIVIGVIGKNDNGRNFNYFENPLYVLNTTIFQRIPMAFHTVGYYIKLLFMPHPLLFYYGYNYVPLGTWSNSATIITMLVTLPAGLYSIIKSKSKNPAVFGALFFFVAISMFSNLVKPAVGIIAERFLFVASIGFCICAAYFLLKFTKVNFQNTGEKLKFTRSFKIIAIAIIALSFVKVVTRNTAWKDAITLYETDLPVLKNSAKAHALYCGTIARLILANPNYPNRAKLLESTIQNYKEALAIDSSYVTSYNNLGTMYFLKKEYKVSENYFKQALYYDTGYVEAYYNYGYCFQKYYSVYHELAVLFQTLSEDHKHYARSIYNDSLQLENLFDGSAVVVTDSLINKNYRNIINNSYNDLFQAVEIKNDKSVKPKIKQNVFDKAKQSVRYRFENAFKEIYTPEMYNVLALQRQEIKFDNDTIELIQTNFVRAHIYEQFALKADSIGKTMYDKAVFNMKRALFYKPDYFPPYNNLQDLYLSTMDTASLVTLCKDGMAVKSLQENEQFWKIMAKVSINSGNTSTAIKYLIQRLQLNEDIISKSVGQVQILKDKEVENKPFMRESTKTGYLKKIQSMIQANYNKAKQFNQSNIYICNFLVVLFTDQNKLDEMQKYQELSNKFSLRF